MASKQPNAALTRARAWLVTGPLGRGLAFAIDFGVAIKSGLAQRRRRLTPQSDPTPPGRV